MGTAIIGIILILGIFGGISHTVDLYAPQYSDNDTFHQEVYNHFQKMSVDEIKENHTVQTIVDTIIQDAMAFVMNVTTVLMIIVFIMILRLKDKKINKQ